MHIIRAVQRAKFRLIALAGGLAIAGLLVPVG